MTEIYSAVQYGSSTPRIRPDWAHEPSSDRRLWIEAIDPGETTGVCLIAIPYDSIFGDAPRAILHREAIELHGTMQWQVSNACWIARSLCARTVDEPTLIVCEDFDLGGNRLQGCASEADVAIPIRWAAALQYAVECGHADKSMLMFQSRTMAFGTATDERLKAWGMWDKGSDHKRDATRHGIVAIRRISSGSIDPGGIWHE